MWDGSRFTTFNDVNGLHHNDLYTLFKDRAGRLWVGATGVGTYRYDGKSFTLFNTTDRADLNAIFGLQSMAEDAKGILWCGCRAGCSGWIQRRRTPASGMCRAKGLGSDLE